MRRRTPQILLIAALLAVGYLLWDVVIASSTGPVPADDADEYAEFGSFLEADEASAESGPTLSGLGRDGPVGGSRAGNALTVRIEGPAGGRTGNAAEVHFKGRVLDSNGRPAADVRIVMQGTGGLQEVVTDANGRFDKAARPGRYALLFDGGEAGGLLVRQYMLDGAPKDDLEFALREPATISVAVKRGDEGVAETQVELTSRFLGDAAHFELFTDLDGLATFEGLVPGRYDLVAQVPDGPLVRHTAEAVAASRRDVKLLVPDGIVLKGVVRAGQDGPGVEGAAITLRTRPWRSHGLFETVFESGPDGAFEVVVPKGRPQHIEVVAESFAPWPTERQRRAILKSLRNLVRKGPVTRNVVLRGGAALSGLVQDEEQRPLPGLALRFKPRRGPAASALTKEDGRYSVAQLNPGRYIVQIETPGYFPVRGQVMAVSIPGGPTPAPQELDLTLVGSRRLAGVVLSPAGKAAVGTRVWIVGGGREVRSARDTGRLLETFTDKAGVWAIADIPPERNVVVRAALGLLEADPFPAPYRTPPTLPITLRLKGTGTLRGLVEDLATRSSVRGARVRVVPDVSDGRTGHSVLTDERGEFLLEGLLPGGWKLTPSKTGYLVAQPQDVSVPREGETRVTLQLDPGEVFAGTVVDEAGKPLRYARISVRGTPDGEEKSVSRGASVNVAGRFRLTGFKRGVYRVTAWRKGYRTSRTDDLHRGDSRLQFVLRLVRAR